MKRTPWFQLRDQQPVNGEDDALYETRCKGAGNIVWLKPKWVLLGRQACPDCQWRGLAEKP